MNGYAERLTRMQDKTSVTIRDAHEDDYAAVLALNKADVEVLSPLDMDTLERLASYAEFFWVVEVESVIAGFMVAMREQCGYWSDNYKWFDSRYSKFLYVDRIVVSGDYRGMHIASSLYKKLIEKARETKTPHILAEIDIAPIYNEPSLRFHSKLGFNEVGTKPYGDSITVSLQELELDSA